METAAGASISVTIKIIPTMTDMTLTNFKNTAIDDSLDLVLFFENFQNSDTVTSIFTMDGFSANYLNPTFSTES